MAPLFDFYFSIAALNAGAPGEGTLALERYLLQFPKNRSAQDQQCQLPRANGYRNDWYSTYPFGVVSCNNDCVRPDGSQENNGTFATVIDGQISVLNSAGTTEFSQQKSILCHRLTCHQFACRRAPAMLADKGAASRRGAASATLGKPLRNRWWAKILPTQTRQPRLNPLR